jgi:hypothetical protein
MVVNPMNVVERGTVTDVVFVYDREPEQINPQNLGMTQEQVDQYLREPRYITISLQKPNSSFAKDARAFDIEVVSWLVEQGKEALIGKEMAFRIQKRDAPRGGEYWNIVGVAEWDEWNARGDETAPESETPPDKETFDEAINESGYRYLLLEKPKQKGEDFVQWHMDRRTALMQAEGEGHGQVAQAELLFRWLRGWIEVPIGNLLPAINALGCRPWGHEGQETEEAAIGRLE